MHTEPPPRTQRDSESGAQAPVLFDVADLFVRKRDGAALISGVSFQIRRQEVFGLVGESGSGKTLTALASLGLLPDGLTASGAVRLNGMHLLGKPERHMRSIRGSQIGMIFQEPVAALNPVFTVGAQIEAALRAHRRMGRHEAHEAAIHALARVRIPNPAERVNDYPHQFSGGMCQRIMIAMAISGGAKLLIADEPTTALDVTIQHEIIQLLRELVSQDGLSVLFISHDLGLVAQFCDRLAVAYAGEIVETGPARAILTDPRHPYTRGLVRCVVDMDEIGILRRGIPGSPPLAGTWPDGCRFRARCEMAQSGCESAQQLKFSTALREVRCWRSEPDPRGAATAPPHLPGGVPP